MAAFDPPYGGGGRGGLFPFLNSLINWEHPLAANLLFFAVPAPYGYFDLVRRLPMPHQPTTAGAEQSSIQLFGQTPLGVAAWSYGNGNTNPRGAYAVTPQLSLYQPVTSMTVACGCWSFPYKGGYNGTVNRLVSATSGTDTTGLLAVEIVNTVTAVVGGGGLTATTADGALNLNNSQVTHGVIASYDGVTLRVERDGNQGGNALATSKAWSGINQIRIGDATANSCGRPIFWAAAWSSALMTAGSSALANLATAGGSAEGAVSRNPRWGDIPRGLLLPRPFHLRYGT